MILPVSIRLVEGSHASPASADVGAARMTASSPTGPPTSLQAGLPARQMRAGTCLQCRGVG